MSKPTQNWKQHLTLAYFTGLSAGLSYVLKDLGPTGGLTIVLGLFTLVEIGEAICHCITRYD